MDALPSSEHKGVALRQLLAVLGLAEHPPAENPPTEQPPQYMLDLYHAVADAEGVTRAPGLLEGNVVRSFLEKGKRTLAAVTFPVAHCTCIYIIIMCDRVSVIVTSVVHLKISLSSLSRS